MTIVIAVWVACAFAMPALSEMPASNDAAAPKLRIPEGARPTRYAVTLTIVPGAAKVAGEITRMFHGQISPTPQMPLRNRQ